MTKYCKLMLMSYTVYGHTPTRGQRLKQILKMLCSKRLCLVFFDLYVYCSCQQGMCVLFNNTLFVLLHYHCVLHGPFQMAH